jgi:hypothetical protein
MTARTGATLALGAFLSLACTPDPGDPPPLDGAEVRPEPPMLGAQPTRDASPSTPATGPALLTWHGGGVLQTAAVTAVFWGPRWADPSFAADKVVGLDTFYDGYVGSRYALTASEYTDANGLFPAALAYEGHVTDTAASPTRPPGTAAVVAEVCRAIPKPVANGYYPVYADTRRGSAQYCGWHSFGVCAGVPVQVGFFFDVDDDLACDPHDPRAIWSEGLTALANMSAHELSEAVTDPRRGGWYDPSGDENGDKCAWSFGLPFVTLANGSTWKLQGEWSNAAYRAGTGDPNQDGHPGCLSGR